MNNSALFFNWCIYCWIFIIGLAPISPGPSTKGHRSPLVINPKGDVNIHYEIDVNEYSKWKVKKAEISYSEKQGIIEILELFNNNRFVQAKQQLINLPAKSAYANIFKKNFLPAILMQEKKYYEALEAVINKYEGLPNDDIRYRWQIAYITYFYRRDKGLTEVENSINKLRKKYKRNDISQVWMAIHPNAFSRLLNSYLYPYQSLHEKQLDILEHVVDSYPDDPFIDHAFYFLHQYEKIINLHPRSIIIDIILF